MRSAPFSADAEHTALLREVNELRRSRSLTQLVPETTTFRVTNRNVVCRRLRRRCHRRRDT